jgi:hypothetical protein
MRAYPFLDLFSSSPSSSNISLLILWIYGIHLMLAQLSGVGARSQLLEELDEPAEEAEVRLKIKAEDFKPIADATIEAFRSWVEDEAGPLWQVDTPNHEGLRVQVLPGLGHSGMPCC